jgi:hypothetical protein
MSEHVGAGARERRFGHIVAQTELGEVYSLDLFETPDLVCRGLYMPPPVTPWTPEGVSRARRQPTPLPEVELRVGQRVMEALRIESQIEEDPEGFAMYGRPFGFEAYGPLRLVSRDQVQGTEVWTGSVAGEGPWLMTFVLQRYGSPELIVMIAAIYLLLHIDRRADELDEECWRRAVEACGERRIKRYKTGRTWMSLAEIGLSHNCEWECM